MICHLLMNTNQSNPYRMRTGDNEKDIGDLLLVSSLLRDYKNLNIIKYAYLIGLIGKTKLYAIQLI